MTKRRPLTYKQRRFATLVAGGQELVTAYRMAYNASQMRQSSVRVESSRLAALPHVAHAITWLRGNLPPEEFSVNALEDEWVAARIQEVAVSQFSSSRTKLSALETLARIQGMI